MTRRIWEVTPITGSPVGFEQITVGTGVTQLTPPASADRALMKLVSTTGPIHFLDTGTNPDASTGMLIEGGDAIVYDAEGGLAKLRFIRTSAATVDGDLRVLYYGES